MWKGSRSAAPRMRLHTRAWVSAPARIRSWHGVWCGLGWSGQLPFTTTPAAGGATPVGLRIHLVSSDPLFSLQGPALQWKWKRGPRRHHHARDRASEARARPEPATVASSLHCPALRRAASAVFENDASAALFSLCRAGRLAPRVPILGCAPRLRSTAAVDARAAIAASDAGGRPHLLTPLSWRRGLAVAASS